MWIFTKKSFFVCQIRLWLNENFSNYGQIYDQTQSWKEKLSFIKSKRNYTYYPAMAYFFWIKFFFRQQLKLFSPKCYCKIDAKIIMMLWTMMMLNDILYKYYIWTQQTSKNLHHWSNMLSRSMQLWSSTLFYLTFRLSSFFFVLFR